ncbi:hypothetical protein [Streptomyces cavernae]|uniref:hypothetical protein n=1 Tax=Streptomyces cavernae TaxID=2259034 RepID=UPI0012D9BC81|nr:hypothetical protein [Streptomyces cavernae]
MLAGRDRVNILITDRHRGPAFPCLSQRRPGPRTEAKIRYVHVNDLAVFGPTLH